MQNYLKQKKQRPWPDLLEEFNVLEVLVVSLICLLPVRPTQVILAATKKMQNT